MGGRLTEASAGLHATTTAIMTAEPMDEGHEARKAHQHAPHPAETSAEIATLAPNIEVQKDWRAPEFLQVSIERVDAFLSRNTPK